MVSPNTTTDRAYTEDAVIPYSTVCHSIVTQLPNKAKLIAATQHVVVVVTFDRALHVFCRRTNTLTPIANNVSIISIDAVDDGSETIIVGGRSDGRLYIARWSGTKPPTIEQHVTDVGEFVLLTSVVIEGNTVRVIGVDDAEVQFFDLHTMTWSAVGEGSEEDDLTADFNTITDSQNSEKHVTSLALPVDVRAADERSPTPAASYPKTEDYNSEDYNDDLEIVWNSFSIYVISKSEHKVVQKLDLKAANFRSFFQIPSEKWLIYKTSHFSCRILSVSTCFEELWVCLSSRLILLFSSKPSMKSLSNKIATKNVGFMSSLLNDLSLTNPNLESTMIAKTSSFISMAAQGVMPDIFNEIASSSDSTENSLVGEIEKTAPRAYQLAQPYLPQNVQTTKSVDVQRRILRQKQNLTKTPAKLEPTDPPLALLDHEPDRTLLEQALDQHLADENQVDVVYDSSTESETSDASSEFSIDVTSSNGQRQQSNQTEVLQYSPFPNAVEVASSVNLHQPNSLQLNEETDVKSKSNRVDKWRMIAPKSALFTEQTAHHICPCKRINSAAATDRYVIYTCDCGTYVGRLTDYTWTHHSLPADEWCINEFGTIVWRLLEGIIYAHVRASKWNACVSRHDGNQWIRADMATSSVNALAVNSSNAVYATTDGTIYMQQMLTNALPVSVRIKLETTVDWLCTRLALDHRLNLYALRHDQQIVATTIVQRNRQRPVWHDVTVPTTSTFTHISVTDNLLLCIDTRGQLWIGDVNTNTWAIVNTPSIPQFCLMTKGTMILLTHIYEDLFHPLPVASQLWMCDGGRISTVFYDPLAVSVPESRPCCITSGDVDNIWMSTMTTVSKWTKATGLTAQKDINQYTTDVCSMTMITSISAIGGTLWLATRNDGVHIIDANHEGHRVMMQQFDGLNHYFVKLSTSQHGVWAIDNHAKLWYRHCSQSETSTHLSQAWITVDVPCLDSDDQVNGVWCSSSGCSVWLLTRSGRIYARSGIAHDTDDTMPIGDAWHEVDRCALSDTKSPMTAEHFASINSLTFTQLAVDDRHNVYGVDTSHRIYGRHNVNKNGNITGDYWQYYPYSDIQFDQIALHDGVLFALDIKGMPYKRTESFIALEGKHEESPDDDIAWHLFDIL